MKSSLNWQVSSIHSKLFTGRLFTSQSLNYDNSLFLSYSFMYLLLAFAYRSIACHIPPLISFLTINIIWISAENSNFNLVFFKAACYANPGVERNFVESKW